MNQVIRRPGTKLVADSPPFRVIDFVAWRRTPGRIRRQMKRACIGKVRAVPGAVAEI